jgi:hypothetical protein
LLRLLSSIKFSQCYIDQVTFTTRTTQEILWSML